jgi:hypothetical protein
MRLPNFIIGGGRRCGTTSLYYWIKKHPEIYFYPQIDSDYFIEQEIIGTYEWQEGEVDAENWEKTHNLENYKKLFGEGKNFSIIGQKDANYLFWKPSHERLAKYLPNAHFIFTLRNPIDRAWSHYWHEVGKGRENLSFEEAIQLEEERARKSAYARLHLSYISRGFYDESLESFFRYIPKEQVLIVTLEETKLHPIETLKEIYKFIGVTPDLGLELAGERYNKNITMLKRSWAKLPMVSFLDDIYTKGVKIFSNLLMKDVEKKRRIRAKALRIFRRSAIREKMKRETRDKLIKIYTPHIKKLEKLLQREFSEWNL